MEAAETLKKLFPNKRVLEVTSADVNRYLDSLKVGLRRKFNVRGRLAQFFNWCIAHGHIATNACEKIEIHVDSKDVTIFAPAEALRPLTVCRPLSLLFAERYTLNSVEFNHESSRVIICGSGCPLKPSEPFRPAIFFRHESVTLNGTHGLIAKASACCLQAPPVTVPRFFDLGSPPRSTKIGERRYPAIIFPHLSAVDWAEFSHDEKHIATASLDGTACVWDAVTGRPLMEPIHHNRRALRTVFSPDDHFLLTASLDGTARVWDSSSGRPVSEVFCHASGVADCAFSPDGRFLATAGLDGKTVIRDWTPGADNPPQWLGILAEAVGGYHINDSGIAIPEANPEEDFAKARDCAQSEPGSDKLAGWSEVVLRVPGEPPAVSLRECKRPSSGSRTPCGGEPQIHSHFIATLNEHEQAWEHVPVSSYWTPFDLMILHATGSRWPVGENKEIFCPLHPWMARKHEVIADISARITA